MLLKSPLLHSSLDDLACINDKHWQKDILSFDITTTEFQLLVTDEFTIHDNAICMQNFKTFNFPPIGANKGRLSPR